jgi:hypothetical protein
MSQAKIARARLRDLDRLGQRDVVVAGEGGDDAGRLGCAGLGAKKSPAPRCARR